MWKKIDSAPKDGTKVLGYDPEDNGYISVMYFQPRWNEGWISADYDAVQFNPTHWMPLPPRPLTDEELEFQWNNPLIP